MKPFPFFFLLLGILVLPGLEADKNPDAKRRDVRFLQNLFSGYKYSYENREVSAKSDSSLAVSEFCQGPCREGWISHMGQCYMFVQEQKTWAEAERVCQGRAVGGHLTSIFSAAQNDFLVKLASYADKGITQLWTGGNHEKGGSLKWTDGSLVNFMQRPLNSILNTIGGLFNNIFNIQICLSLNVGVQGNWDGCNCNEKLSFICSYKPNLTAP